MCSSGRGTEARPQKASQAPGGEEGTEFRGNFIHPLPPPLQGFVALRLTAVDVVTF